MSDPINDNRDDLLNMVQASPEDIQNAVEEAPAVTTTKEATMTPEIPRDALVEGDNKETPTVTPNSQDLHGEDGQDNEAPPEDPEPAPLQPLPKTTVWEQKGKITLERDIFAPLPPRSPEDDENLVIIDSASRPSYICSVESDMLDYGFDDLFTESVGDQTEFSLKKLAYGAAIQAAYPTIMSGSGLIKALTRLNGDWRQGIPEPGSKKSIAPRFNPGIRNRLKGGETLTGSMAVDTFLSRNRDTRSTQVPLYHTGIWVKMAPATISYLAEIDRALALLNSQLGIETNGLVDSNEDARFNEILVDAALKLITSSSYPYQNPMDLKKIISHFDMESLIWGMAMGAYGTGYDVNVPCTNPKCGDMDEFRAAPTRMRVVDNSRFTKWQIEHMSKGINHKCTAEELEKYADEFDIAARDSAKYEYRSIGLLPDERPDTFHFRISTIAEYFQFADMWFSRIDQALKESMGQSYNTPELRRSAIESALAAEDLCRYGHFIEKISLANPNSALDDSVIEDTDTIRNILKQLVSDVDGATGLMEAINDFIQDVRCVIYGVKNVPCHACGEYRLVDGNTPMVVPFKVSVGFFILLQHKMRNAGMTPLADLTMLGTSISTQETTAADYMSSLPDQVQ